MKPFAGLKKLLGIGASGEEVARAVRGVNRSANMTPAEPGFENRDQRYRMVDKIVPPFPLPHVSRASLRRIANPLPRPETCPYCSGPVGLDSNDAIYRGRRYGDWPYIYLCESGCDAYVGLHPNTDVPLGTLADRDTREARKEAKQAFFDWQDMVGLRKDRNAAYAKLAEWLDIEVAVCHFAMFDAERCQQALAHLGNAMAEYLQEQDKMDQPFNDDIPF